MKKMFLAILYLVSIISLAQIGLSAIVINEVYFDPVNTETGGEAIELYNTGEDDIDISGYVIKTKGSNVDAILPSGKTIRARGYFLIADAGFSTLKDNSSWPNADYEEAISLTNTDGGVAIVNNNSTLDAVGWGNPSNIPVELYEESPATIAKEGLSLQRKTDGVDSGDNQADFTAGSPSLTSGANVVENRNNSDIKVSVSVIDFHTKIGKITIEDDDNLTSGYQISPYPGANRKIVLNMNIKENDVSKIRRAWMVFEGNEKEMAFEKIVNATDISYVGNITMQFHDEAKEYNMIFNVMNRNNITTTLPVSFEYLSLTSFEIDGKNIGCISAQNSSCTILGDYDMSTRDRITIRNLGNTKVDFIVKPTNVSMGEKKFPLENIFYSFSTGMNDGKNLAGNLDQYNDIDFGSGANSMLPLSFRFIIPKDASEGKYTGSVRLIGTEG
jgi:hypothetical protein